MTLLELAAVGIGAPLLAWLVAPNLPVPRMPRMPRGYTRYVITCAGLSAIILAGAAWVAHNPQAGSVSIAPYSYGAPVTVNGVTLLCTVNVSSTDSMTVNGCVAP